MIPTDGEPVHHGSLDNVGILHEVFRGRFTFLHKSSHDVEAELRGTQFDLFNIDGGHHMADIRNDFQLAVNLNIPWILVDDFLFDVVKVYKEEFANHFFPVKVYQRDDKCMGQPIPRVLMRRRNVSLPHLPYSFI
jgi:hypothetical protein